MKKLTNHLLITFCTLFIIPIALLSIAGCTRTTDNHDRPSYRSARNGHFVQSYRVADDLKLSAREIGGSFAITVSFVGKDVGHEIKKDEQEFHAFAEKYNDVAFDGWSNVLLNRVLSHPVTSIQVMADKDYNEAHKSGANLSDLIVFCASSPFGYIQSGYKLTTPAVDNKDFYDRWGFFGGEVSHGADTYKPIELPLQTVNENNTQMLWYVCHLWFQEAPQNTGTYTFTVNIRWNGQTISKQLTHTF